MPRKIVDIAKELQIGPYDLVEKLKSENFDVKNPMSELTDEEVAKALSFYQAGESAQTEEKAKKTTKKKVTKKKTKKTAKKVVKKVAEGDASSAESVSEDNDDEGKKKTSIRRKVIRRKSSTEEAEVQAESPVEEAPVVVEETPVEAVVEEAPVEAKATTEEQEPAEVEVEAAPKEEVEKPRFGLRVVKAAEPKKAEAPKPKKEEEGSKPHKFTPVYTPPAKEKTEDRRPVASGADKGEGDSTSKKRIGGLASMMSGKKTNVNRAQTLNQTRADSELKSYGTLSSLGRPIYNQVKRKKIYTGATLQTQITELKESKRVVYLHDGATLGELSKKLKIKFKEMKDKILDINLLGKVDDYVGMSLASQIAALYDYRVENKAFDEDAVLGKEGLTEEEKSKHPLRNPIIAIMGHVDHGKTTLLDHIRNARVVAGEAGGITQHIGAYSVMVGEKTLSFLDTPGHAAFAAMRQRGADVTDIVVLVVAADDGVMPQTRESIKYCKQAGVPIIVAVNKMDKEGANPDRVKAELAELGITPEDWGGDTMFAHISALKGEGIEELLESIALQAEVLELRADPTGKAEGVVIESKLEQGRGPVATVLIQSGTLKKGESIVVGECYGRARSLTDDKAAQVTSAGPSTPVQILGLDSAPSPGDTLNVAKNEREAKKIVQNRINERKALESTSVKKKMTLEDFFAAATEASADKKVLNLVIRTDVQGSFEAIKQSLEVLGNDEVSVKVIAGGVGAITDSDVMMASSAEGFIIGFNMRPLTSARRLAEQHGVDVKTYSVIYEVINDIKLALEGLLDPEFIEEFIGRAEVRETFSIPKIGFIAGSIVVDGKIKDGCNIRLLRQGKIVFDGKMSSLKRFKDDVKEVKNGYECGIGLENFNDVKVNDIFEAYMMIEKKRTLEDVVLENEL